MSSKLNHLPHLVILMTKSFKGDIKLKLVSELESEGVLFVEDGNHGEYRPLPHEFVDVGTPFVRPPNLVNGLIDLNQCDKINEKALNRVRKGIGKGGDIVLTHNATIGRLAITKDTDPIFVTNPQTTVWRVKNREIIDPRYLYYFMCSSGFQDQLEAHKGRNATFDYVSLTKQRSLVIPLIDIDLQRKISSTLKCLDSKIEINCQTNTTLEAIAQTLFKSWFVDFDPVRAKQQGREPESMDSDTAALFPDSFEESELGLVPSGWMVGKIDTVLSRLSAKIRYKKDHLALDGTTPIYEQGAGILLGYHDGPPQYIANVNDPAFIFGDHTCVTHLSCEPFDISQNVIPLKGKDRATLWVYYAVKDKQTFQEYRRHWMELIVKDVVISPTHICDAFAKTVSLYHLKMESNVRQSRSLSMLRDTLLPRLISGQLRLPESVDTDT